MLENPYMLGQESLREAEGSSTKAAIALFDAGADLRIGLGAEFHS